MPERQEKTMKLCYWVLIRQSEYTAHAVGVHDTLEEAMQTVEDYKELSPSYRQDGWNGAIEVRELQPYGLLVYSTDQEEVTP